MGGDDPPELSLRADGYLVATRICPGWELPSVVDAANGTVRVTATFTEAGLDPVVWGTVSACRYRAAGSRIELTPSSERDALRVYWGEAVRRSAAALGADAGKGAAAGVVLSLALRATVEGAPLSLDLDLRLAEGNALEYLLPAGGGWVVVQASGEGSFAVRSIEGTYACDPSFACVLNGAEVER